MSFMCNFKGNYEIILSKERFNSYDNDINVTETLGNLKVF